MHSFQRYLTKTCKLTNLCSSFFSLMCHVNGTSRVTINVLINKDHVIGPLQTTHG